MTLYNPGAGGDGGAKRGRAAAGPPTTHTLPTTSLWIPPPRPPPAVSRGGSWEGRLPLQGHRYGGLGGTRHAIGRGTRVAINQISVQFHDATMMACCRSANHDRTNIYILPRIHRLEGEGRYIYIFDTSSLFNPKSKLCPATGKPSHGHGGQHQESASAPLQQRTRTNPTAHILSIVPC